MPGKLQRIVLLLWLLPVLPGCSCGDPDPANAVIPPPDPWDIPKTLAKSTLSSVTQPFILQGFELKEDRAVYKYFWRCTQKRGDTTYIVSAMGYDPEHVERVEAKVINFKKKNVEQDVRSFFVQVTKVAYHGPRTEDALAWVRENFGKQANAVTYIEGIEFMTDSAGYMHQLIIRPDVKRPPRGITYHAAPAPSSTRNSRAERFSSPQPVERALPQK